MDFDALFTFYLEEFREKTEEINSRQTYKQILKNIKYLFLTTKVTIFNAKLSLFSINFVLSTEPSFKSSRFLLIEQNQIEKMQYYAIVIGALKEITIFWYKSHKLKEKEILLYLQSLIEIITDCLRSELEEYDNIKEKLEESTMEKENFKITSYTKDLKEFLIKTIAQNDDLNFKMFQERILKR